MLRVYFSRLRVVSGKQAGLSDLRLSTTDPTNLERAAHRHAGIANACNGNGGGSVTTEGPGKGGGSA